jgi:hypothetical protein
MYRTQDFQCYAEVISQMVSFTGLKTLIFLWIRIKRFTDLKMENKNMIFKVVCYVMRKK